MEMNKAFEVACSKTEQLLLSKGYEKAAVAPSETQLNVMYVGENAYSIIYTYSNKKIILRSCGADEGEPDNKWKTLATWLYDPESDGIKEAESIAEDFAETIRGPKQTSAVQKQKKRKKDGEQSVDPLFLANRMVTYFPKLKDEIAYEKAHYSDFRGVTFAEEHIVDRFAELVESSDAKRLEKLSQGLSALYTAGDLDTKGIITYDLLNAVKSDEKFNSLISAFSDADKKIAKAARNLRGKKIKPEKEKKRSKFISDTLNNMQQ